MNCKPGDLAIVIRTSMLYIDWVGTIVKVGERYPYSCSMPTWYVTWPGRKPISCKGSTQGCWDVDLRPVSGLSLQEDEQTDIKLLA